MRRLAAKRAVPAVPPETTNTSNEKKRQGYANVARATAFSINHILRSSVRLAQTDKEKPNHRTGQLISLRWPVSQGRWQPRRYDFRRLA
jgi:hypothetical protein